MRHHYPAPKEAKALPSINQVAAGERYSGSAGYSEGFVEVQYTILPDGTVADDITVTRLLGSPEFAEVTKRTARTYKYAPAMVDGMPVAISHKLRAIFGVGDLTGARPSISKGYVDAGGLLKNGKIDEARTQLTQMLNLLKLNFYERCMIMYPLALIAMQRQEYDEAKRLSETALFLPGGLSPSIKTTLMRLNLRAALFQGDIAYAGKGLDQYSEMPFYDRADPVIKEVVDARKKFDDLASYGVNAKIPDAVDGDGFEMFLYRRYFGFKNVVGKLSHLTVSCRERQAVSPISLSAEWSVPKSWSDCSIFVKGTPGTTFQVVQFAAPASTSQEMQPR